MKKTIAITFIALVFVLSGGNIFAVSTPVPKEMLPAQPAHHPAVTDFANVIKDDVESKLETDLINYYNSTSIAVVVVTVDTLNGYEYTDFALSLYNTWGVGNKSNRGVLVMVAPKEHKCQLQTGYGIEFFLTDAKCFSIFENTMKSYFKKDDFSGGIRAGVDAVIAHLGTMSWEDRERTIKEKEEAEAMEAAKSKEETQTLFMNIGLFAAIGLCIAWIAWLIKIAKRRRIVNKFNKSLVADIKTGEHMIELIAEGYKSEPSWAREELKLHLKSSNKSIDDAKALIKESAQKLKKRDTVEEASRRSHEAAQLIEKAKESFNKADGALRAKVKSFSDKVEGDYKQASDFLFHSKRALVNFSNDGYRFNRINSEMERTSKEFSDLKPKLADKENHKEICELSLQYIEFTKNLLSTAKEQVDRKKQVDSNVEKIEQQAKELRQKSDTHENVINELKENYSRSVWSDLAAGFATFIPLIANERIDKSIKVIKDANSIEKQDLRTASSMYDNLEKEVNSVRDFYKKIQDTKTAQERAKKELPGAIKAAEKAVAESFEAIKDPDVKSGSKEMAKKAQQKLSQAKISSGGSILDWYFLYLLFVECKTDAESATASAQHDNNEAEARRRRAAEEAAAAERARKRRQEEEEESSRRSSSSSYSSGSSWGSGGGGGGGGFGGFSGGSSGGGGGGGSW